MRRAALPAAGGPKHRPLQQAARLQLQGRGHDTVEANEKLGFGPDQRDYGIGAQILLDLGVRRMRLMTNNPSKYIALSGYGLEIVERVPLEVPPTEATRDYLKVKRELGHLAGARTGGSANGVYHSLPPACLAPRTAHPRAKTRTEHDIDRHKRKEDPTR